jgi:catechol 2,3-dioxygenase-like lactoylglutathione lyase family enzyme
MANNVNVTGFHHIAMDVKDIDASIRFYTQVLGFGLAYTWGEGEKRGCMIDCGNGNYVELFQAKPGEGRPEGHWKHLALKCTDTKSAIERVRAAGFPVTVETKDVTIPSSPKPLPIRIAFFKGPDGETVEFFQTF